MGKDPARRDIIRRKEGALISKSGVGTTSNRNLLLQPLAHLGILEANQKKGTSTTDWYSIDNGRTRYAKRSGLLSLYTFVAEKMKTE